MLDDEELMMQSEEGGARGKGGVSKNNAGSGGARAAGAGAGAGGRG